MVLNIAQLRNITENDNLLMHEVVAQLVSDTAEQLDMLRRAIERGDMKKCVKLAHGAKGACATVGAASMAEMFRSLELRATAGDIRLCRSSTEELLLELEKLRSEADSF